MADGATGYQEKLGRIIDLLEQRAPRGLSVSEIARTLGTNRVSTAKYLDVLATGGDVRVERFGRSKLYHPSDRLPLTELFESLPNAIVILDGDLQVRMVNTSFMTTLDIRQGRNLVGPPSSTSTSPSSRNRRSGGISSGCGVRRRVSGRCS